MSVTVYIAVQEGPQQLVIDGPLKLLAQLVQALQVQPTGEDCEPKPVLPCPQVKTQEAQGYA